MTIQSCMKTFKPIIINIVNPKLYKYQHAYLMALIILLLNFIISIPLIYYIINDCITLSSSLDPNIANNKGYTCTEKKYTGTYDVTYVGKWKVGNDVGCVEDDDPSGTKQTSEIEFSIVAKEHDENIYYNALNNINQSYQLIYTEDSWSIYCTNGWECLTNILDVKGSQAPGTDNIEFIGSYSYPNFDLEFVSELVLYKNYTCPRTWDYVPSDIANGFDSLYSNIILNCEKNSCPGFFSILGEYLAIIAFVDGLITILVIIIYVYYTEGSFRKFNKKKTELEAKRLGGVIGEMI